jgi:hypothetical protein
MIAKIITLIAKGLGFVLMPIARPLAGLYNQLVLRFGGESARRRRRAQRLASQLLSELSRLGFTRRVVAGTTKRRRAKRQRIIFEQPLLMTTDELWCPVNLSKLPTGVRTDDLRDESVIRSLMDRTDCSVRIDYLANGKFCFVVRHGGAQFPEVFNANKIEYAPELSQLALPAGVNADGEQIFIDLDDCIHLLVAGATGGGKTTLQHVALTTLINRNTADDLELWLIDLKQTEFNLYRPLMPKKGEGIVKAIAVEPEEAIDLLDRALKEINRRNGLMVQHNATNLADLSQSVGLKLRKIVIFIDEFAQLTLNTSKLGKQSIGKIAENYLTRIAALGRSAGVRIVISTQMVNSQVVSSLIRANFENRIAFSTADWRQSQLVVESSEADGLPKGRAVMRIKGAVSMVQTALITARQVRIEVERVAQFGPDGAWGEDLELARFVKDAKLLIGAACQQYEGAMARSKILALEGVRGVVSYDRFNEVCQRLERDGVLEPARSNKPRKVAKGFFNRPALIDNLYGLVDAEPTTEPTTEQPAGLPCDSSAAVEAHQEEPEPAPAPIAAVVCRVDTSATSCAPEDDDPPAPTWWKQIEPLAVPAAKPIKRVKIAQPKRRKAS